LRLAGSSGLAALTLFIDEGLKHYAVFWHPSFFTNFVGGFVSTTLESFGYDINRHFNAIGIEWE
jgi:hypothetical protein